MSIITLTTDYGIKDHFVGVLKGKILSYIESAIIVDISHLIDPFNILEASYIIGSSYHHFPKGTIHIIGVDTELNKENQHLVVEWQNHFFICADNGILSVLFKNIQPERIFSIYLDKNDPLLNTDLDIFIKVAFHITQFKNWDLIGKEIKFIKNLIALEPKVSVDKKTILGNIIYIDHFGNAVTDITKDGFLKICNNRKFEIPIFENRLQKKSLPIRNIWSKYSDVAQLENFDLKTYEGAKLAVFNEAGHLEIAIYKSNPKAVGTANSLLGLSKRDTITINFFDN